MNSLSYLFRLGLLAYLFIFSYSRGLLAQSSTTHMTVCQGITSPDDWQDYIRVNEEVQGIKVVVNTSSCNFDTIPHYIPTLEATNGNHWYITGSQSVYNPTPDGFEVYVRFIDRPSEEPLVGVRELMNPLTADGAKEIGLKLRWTAICTGDCVVATPEEGGEETTNIDAPSTDQAVNDLFEISPNPVDRVINIETQSSIDRFTLTSSSGQVIGTYFSTAIDVSNLAPGVYYLKGESGQKTGIAKVIKR